MKPSLTKNETGSVLVEFAILFPIICTTLLIGIGLSIVTWQKTEVTRAVTIGSIYLESPHTSLDPCAAAVTRMQAASPALQSSLISITITESGNGNGASCPDLQNGSGQAVTINASYPCFVPYFQTCSVSDSAEVTE